MKAKHTPGPWINDGDSVSALVDPDNSVTYIAPICVIDNKWLDEITKANAALIAAAPDLLAALEVFENLCSNGAYPGTDDLIQARAAIRKARGEA